jgi:hypothetical protein
MLKGKEAYARCSSKMVYGRHKTFELRQAEEISAKMALKSKRGKNWKVKFPEEFGFDNP